MFADIPFGGDGRKYQEKSLHYRNYLWTYGMLGISCNGNFKLHNVYPT